MKVVDILLKVLDILLKSVGTWQGDTKVLKDIFLNVTVWSMFLTNVNI